MINWAWYTQEAERGAGTYATRASTDYIIGNNLVDGRGLNILYISCKESWGVLRT